MEKNALGVPFNHLGHLVLLKHGASHFMLHSLCYGSRILDDFIEEASEFWKKKKKSFTFCMLYQVALEIHK